MSRNVSGQHAYIYVASWAFTIVIAIPILFYSVTLAFLLFTCCCAATCFLQTCSIPEYLSGTFFFIYDCSFSFYFLFLRLNPRVLSPKTKSNAIAKERCPRFTKGSERICIGDNRLPHTQAVAYSRPRAVGTRRFACNRNSLFMDPVIRAGNCRWKVIEMRRELVKLSRALAQLVREKGSASLLLVSRYHFFFSAFLLAFRR